MGKKQAFLSQNEKTPKGKLARHLNIIISDPDDEQNYLVVPVTTFHEEIKNPNNEQNSNTCEMNTPDHPWLDHKSWVCFSRAKKMTYAEIYNGLRRGLLVPKASITESTLKRIQAHAKSSIWLPEKLRPFEDFF
jgi:hypothetical protein